MNYTKIEYTNSTDIANILYSKSYQNRIYIDADISKPSYPINEDGVENGDGEFIPSWQKWQKRYSITFRAQEFLADAVSLIPLHNNIIVTTKRGDISVVKDVEVTIDWDDDVECFAQITISFNIDYHIVSCPEVYKTGCELPLYTCQDVITFSSGKFTDPANNGVFKGHYYLVYLTLDDSLKYYGQSSGLDTDVYMFDGSDWIVQDVPNGTLVDVLTKSYYTYLVKYATRTYYKSPQTATGWISDSGSQIAKVAAFVKVGDFAEIEYSSDAINYTSAGKYSWSEVFDGVDIQLPSSGTWYFRVVWFIHGCEYGTSLAISKVIA